MRKGSSHTGRPSPALLRLATMVKILEKRGFSEEGILAFIREKFLSDIRDHDRERRAPSEN